MEQQPAHRPTEQITLTQAVWVTLTDIQKETVLQTLLHVCQQLVAQWKDEATYEPARDPA